MAFDPSPTNGFAASAQGEKDDNELCVFLRTNKVPEAVIRWINEDEIDIDDILEYTEDDMRTFCKEHNIGIAATKKFIKTIKSLKQQQSNGNVVTTPSSVHSSTTTNNQTTSSIATTTPTRSSRVHANINSNNNTDTNTNTNTNTDSKLSSSEICTKLFETGCVGCAIEILSDNSSSDAAISVYETFKKIWQDTDTPLIKLAFVSNLHSISSGTVNIEPIYVAIAKTYPNQADFYINLGRFSMISSFKKDAEQLKPFLTKHLGDSDPIVNKWIDTIKTIQNLTEAGKGVNYVLTTLEVSFRQVFKYKFDKLHNGLNQNNDILTELSDDNKQSETTERTFAKIYIKQAMELNNPDDMGSVFKMDISDGGKSLSIGGTMILTKKQILIKALELDSTYWVTYRLLAQCLTGTQSIYIPTIGFLSKQELFAKERQLRGADNLDEKKQDFDDNNDDYTAKIAKKYNEVDFIVQIPKLGKNDLLGIVMNTASNFSKTGVVIKESNSEFAWKNFPIGTRVVQIGDNWVEDDDFESIANKIGAVKCLNDPTKRRLILRGDQSECTQGCQICIKIEFKNLNDVLHTPLHVFEVEKVKNVILNNVYQLKNVNYKLLQIGAFDNGICLCIFCPSVDKGRIEREQSDIERKLLNNVWRILQNSNKPHKIKRNQHRIEVNMIECRNGMENQTLHHLIKQKFETNEDITMKENNSLIYLVKGVDDGRQAWYYVLVNPSKEKQFLKDLNDNIIHLETSGSILQSAYGDHPEQQITDKITNSYTIE